MDSANPTNIPSLNPSMIPTKIPHHNVPFSIFPVVELGSCACNLDHQGAIPCPCHPLPSWDRSFAARRSGISFCGANRPAALPKKVLTKVTPRHGSSLFQGENGMASSSGSSSSNDCDRISGRLKRGMIASDRNNLKMCAQETPEHILRRI